MPTFLLQLLSEVGEQFHQWPRVSTAWTGLRDLVNNMH